MRLEEHFVNKGASTKDIRDFSEKIFKISKRLTSAKDVKEFGEDLALITSLSQKNIDEIKRLLSD